MQARHFKPWYTIIIAIIVGLSVLIGYAIYVNFIEVSSDDSATNIRSGIILNLSSLDE